MFKSGHCLSVCLLSSSCALTVDFRMHMRFVNISSVLYFVASHCWLFPWLFRSHFIHAFIHSFIFGFVPSVLRVTASHYYTNCSVAGVLICILQLTWNGTCMWCNAKLNSLLLHIDLFLSTITLICGLHMSSLFYGTISMSVIPSTLIGYYSFGYILKSESVMPPVLYFFVEDWFCYSSVFNIYEFNYFLSPTGKVTIEF